MSKGNKELEAAYKALETVESNVLKRYKDADKYDHYQDVYEGIAELLEDSGYLTTASVHASVANLITAYEKLRIRNHRIVQMILQPNFKPLLMNEEMDLILKEDDTQWFKQKVNEAADAEIQRRELQKEYEESEREYERNEHGSEGD